MTDRQRHRPRCRKSRRVRQGIAAAGVCITVAVFGQLTNVPAASACSVAASSGQFEGLATSIDNGTVSFVVDDVNAAGSDRTDPLVELVPGTRVEVDYGTTAKYLRTGVRYKVNVWGPHQDGTFSSGVVVAEDTCGGGGTVYADGRSIDTSLISVAGIHTGGLIALAIGSLVALLVAAAALGRHHDKRRFEKAAVGLQDKGTYSEDDDGRLN